MSGDRDVFYKKWFNLEIDGKIKKVQCVDIEFEGELGPLFMMKPKFGRKFWMTRRELRESTVLNLPQGVDR